VEAALGFTVKSGWAAVVLLGGPAGSPRVLEAGTVDLADPADPDARQPYHAGFGTARAALAALSRPAGPWRAEQKSAARSTAEHGDDA
jgi:hypothetical protein